MIGFSFKYRFSMKNYWRFILILILVLLIGASFYYQEELADFLTGVGEKIMKAEKFSDSVVEKIEKQISAPPPLVAERESAKANLTKAGVIKWTNLQRANFGLPPVSENSELDLAALAKAQDMFENQYFAHEAPNGDGPAEVAAQSGYEYIAIGENLALGNFENDEILVQAWMDSLGHRANILSNLYKEIGVSVIKGTFEGKTTWMAVQEFGLPLSACPPIDEKLKAEIENKIFQAEKLAQTMEIKRQEIDDTRRKSSEYAQKVNEYNLLANEYNNLIASNKALVNLYNSQVRAFNVCISSP